MIHWRLIGQSEGRNLEIQHTVFDRKLLFSKLKANFLTLFSEKITSL